MDPNLHKMLETFAVFGGPFVLFGIVVLTAKGICCLFGVEHQFKWKWGEDVAVDFEPPEAPEGMFRDNSPFSHPYPRPDRRYAHGFLIDHDGYHVSDDGCQVSD